MILTPEPAHMVRPLFVGLRGAAITLLGLLTFCFMAGIDRMQYFGPYFTAIGIAFVLHYMAAWWAICEYRRRQHESNKNA
jgi:hypothetical protein